MYKRQTGKYYPLETNSSSFVACTDGCGDSDYIHREKTFKLINKIIRQYLDNELDIGSACSNYVDILCLDSVISVLQRSENYGDENGALEGALESSEGTHDEGEEIPSVKKQSISSNSIH